MFQFLGLLASQDHCGDLPDVSTLPIGIQRQLHEVVKEVGPKGQCKTNYPLRWIACGDVRRTTKRSGPLETIGVSGPPLQNERRGGGGERGNPGPS